MYMCCCICSALVFVHRRLYMYVRPCACIEYMYMCVIYWPTYMWSILVLLFLVPSPVQNLTAAINVTHLLVTWCAPANPNGLVSYTVEIGESDLLDQQSNLLTSTFATNLSESDLFVEYPIRAYSRYDISVTSFTIAGSGEAVTTTVETSERGK